jgi:hypothetical protein
MKFKHLTFSRGLGAIALTLSGTAMAQAHFGVYIGVPAPVYVAPAPVYAPPSPPALYEQQAPVYAPVPVIAGPALVIGWHGDRYWDGHRYWNRRGWYARGRGDYGRG